MQNSQLSTDEKTNQHKRQEYRYFYLQKQSQELASMTCSPFSLGNNSLSQLAIFILYLQYVSIQKKQKSVTSATMIMKGVELTSCHTSR